MVSIGSIVIRVDDLRRQLDFWTAALDYLPRRGGDPDFVILQPRDGHGPNISLDRVPSTAQVPARGRGLRHPRRSGGQPLLRR